MQSRTSEARLDTVILFTERMKQLAEFYGRGLDLGPFDLQPRYMG